MEKLKEKLPKITGKIGKTKIIVLCGLLGILLILFSDFSDLTGEKVQESENTVAQYKTTMQQELKDILYKIDGVGDVEVLLTIENSVEGVYLENNSTKTKEIEPVIRGVIIACSGGDEPIVIQRVLNATTKALNISNAKVCVTKLRE